MGSILRIGREFAGYRIDALIGRGGMSEVYRAENPRLEKKVAIKVLSSELAEDELFHERFLRESRMAASLEHPHVLPIFDAGEEEGVPYIVMRYIEGPDLKELVEREARLPLERALTILEQVGGALDSAHARGLVHRDVKPANILIDVGANGAGDHAYLSDFGVAKHRLTASGLTSTGHFVGTIDYVSPEQIEGKELDGRTDVYSLGCVLYESLTGVPPFDRDSNVAMIYAHLLDPPPAITERRLDLPAPIDAVVAKALAKAREERFDTCAALVSELRRALAPAAAATRAAGATPLATQLSQPEAPGAAPVTVIAAPGVQPAGALPQTSAATAPSPPTERSDSERTEAAPTLRRKLGRRPVLIGVVAAALIAAAAAVAGAALIHSSSKKSTPSAVHRTPAKTSKTRGQSNGTVTENAVDQTTMVDVYGGPRRYTANRKKLTPAQNARVRALVRAHRSGAAKRYVHTALRARSQRLAQAQSKQARVARLRAARSGSTQTSNTRQRVNALRQKRTHSTSTLNTQERVNQLRQQRTGSTSPSSSSSTRSRVERLRRQRTGG